MEMSLPAKFATVFGIGRVRKAPGTVASAAAVLVALPVMAVFGPAGVVVLAVAATAAGVWFSDLYADECGIADPKDCVIDEFAGQWLALALAPFSLFGVLLAFLLFRLFDIAKPGPVGAAEKLHGGLGIMADDLVAGLLAGVAVYLIDWAGLI